MQVVVITTDGEVKYEDVDLGILSRYPSMIIHNNRTGHNFKMFYDTYENGDEYIVNKLASQILPLIGTAHRYVYGDVFFIHMEHDRYLNQMIHGSTNIIEIQELISFMLHPCEKKEGCSIQ